MIVAGRYYEDRRENLGVPLLTQVEAETQVIAKNPKAFSMVRKSIRKKVMHKFPYSLFYEEHEDHIVILAVAHQRQAFDYWIDRITT